MESVYSEITTDPGKLSFESDPKAIVKATALLLKKVLPDNVFTVNIKLFSLAAFSFL